MQIATNSNLLQEYEVFSVRGTNKTKKESIEFGYEDMKRLQRQKNKRAK